MHILTKHIIQTIDFGMWSRKELCCLTLNVVMGYNSKCSEIGLGNQDCLTFFVNKLQKFRMLKWISQILVFLPFEDLWHFIEQQGHFFGITRLPYPSLTVSLCIHNAVCKLSQTLKRFKVNLGISRIFPTCSEYCCLPENSSNKSIEGYVQSKGNFENRLQNAHCF